ncbi:MAG: cysteine--tRNA ligase [Candidatus Binatia bacterium]
MALQFYNTKTRTKDTFEPLIEGRVSMYVCGVTVYDRCHVGHARSLIFFDAVVRYLRWRGYDVEFVRNITDIDDKIINRAHETGTAWDELAGRFIDSMHADLDALGCLHPDREPRATEHIDEMHELVAALEKRGLAYVVGEGDVYFSVGDYNAYGSLSGRNLDDMLAGARVDVDSRKRGPMDFALWKAAKEGEPSWPSPWGPGRPGWHLECSAMSTKYLGQPFDIHGGGEDLIFPHHENEMAQSCGASGGDFVRYWLHHAFVRIDQEKMSKSLGNVFAIEDVLKEVEAEGLRLNLLSTHYRSPLDFSGDGIAESTRALIRVYETLARAKESNVGSPEYSWRSPEIAPLMEAMDDDFNTAKAVALAFDATRELNRALDAGDPGAASAALGVIEATGDALGMFRQDAAAYLEAYRRRAASGSGVDTEEIERLVAERTAARMAKDFAAADRVRDELVALGVTVEDGPEGTTWKLER